MTGTLSEILDDMDANHATDTDRYTMQMFTDMIRRVFPDDLGKACRVQPDDDTHAVATAEDGQTIFRIRGLEV